jgi:hypothetical protein
MKALRRYIGMSARAATVVTLAALAIFTIFGSFHWRLWWLVPPIWAGLFVLSLLLAPVMRIEPAKRWTASLPWIALVSVSLLALAAVIFGVESAWARLSLALLAAAGLTAGVYGARAHFRAAYSGSERRRNFALRARTEEFLDAIRQMNRVTVQMEAGQLETGEAERSLDEIEGNLRTLLSEIRQAAVRRPPAS